MDNILYLKALKSEILGAFIYGFWPVKPLAYEFLNRETITCETKKHQLCTYKGVIGIGLKIQYC